MVPRFQRALVVGCSGAGKSTFARALGARTGLPVVHIDQLFWDSGWNQVPHDIFLQRLGTAIARDRWIIDGTDASTLDLRLARADVVFWLEHPRIFCLARVLWRVASMYGRVRPDMAEGCPERLNLDFMRYVWRFQTKVAPRIEEALERHGMRERTVRLRSDREAQAYIEAIRVGSRA